MSDKVRCLRIMEYIGSREWVEETLQKGYVPCEGIKDFGNGNKIKSCLMDKFPELLDQEIKSEEDKLSLENESKVMQLEILVNEFEDCLLYVNKEAYHDIDDSWTDCIMFLKKVFKDVHIALVHTTLRRDQYPDNLNDLKSVEDEFYKNMFDKEED